MVVRRHDSPIDVCSHKRSGTHFFMATLWHNFQLPDVGLRSAVFKGRLFVELNGVVRRPDDVAYIPWGKLWKTHGMFKCEMDPSRIIYIVRDPVATLMSLWRFNDPCLREMPLKAIGRKRVEHWYKQTRGYLDSGCTVIRYEDLVGDEHDYELRNVMLRFGLRLQRPRIERFERHVGWYSEHKPQQPKTPPVMLLEAIDDVIPRGFLGYCMDQK